MLGGHFHHTPAAAPVLWWPYLLFGYAVMAVLVPWSIAGFYEGEFSAINSLVIGVIFALPNVLAARWLSHSPYRPISVGCWVLAGLWCAHLVASLGARLFKREG